MIKFSTLAEFKKNIQLGRKVQSTFHRAIIGRDEQNKPTFGIKDNGEREVTIVQSNSCAFKTVKHDGEVVNSWFYYPKAKEVKVVNNDTLEVYEDNILLLTYQIIEK